jgi:hypothetical protein
MNNNWLIFGFAVAVGLVIGTFARPVKWAAFVALITFGVSFLALLMVGAFFLGYSGHQLQALLVLQSGALDPLALVGGVVVGYAALIGAALLAVRVTFGTKRQSHEP